MSAEIPNDLAEYDDDDRPTIVTLCGSTKFYDAFQKANFDETMTGKIVLTVGFYPHATAAQSHGETLGVTPEQKAALDELHLQKIDLSDEILVLNQDGYFGTSTAREIAHAMKTGTPIRWLHDPAQFVEPGAIRFYAELRFSFSVLDPSRVGPMPRPMAEKILEHLPRSGAYTSTLVGIPDGISDEEAFGGDGRGRFVQAFKAEW